MIDPRIYRAALLPVVFALIVVAFSLHERPAPLGSTLAPDAFQGDRALGTLDRLARAHPSRRPGSEGDRALATDVRRSLAHNGFSTSVRRDEQRTAAGARSLETVVAQRTGFTQRRLVVVADRSALHGPARARLSSTAALLELGRALGGRTPRRTIVLISTGGGEAGAAAAIRAAGEPVDGVLVLGDLAGERLRRPFVVPWSNGTGVAPPVLQRTVTAALRTDTGLAPGAAAPAAQFARLAVPLTLGEQGGLAAAGLPAVLISASGETGPGAERAVSATRLDGFGRGVLRSLTALDEGPAAGSGPQSYLAVSRKIVPGWAVRLLVAVLIFPVLATTIDAFARARRRRERVGMWIRWVVAGALPFLVTAIFALVLALTGLLGTVPPGPSPPGAVPLRTGGAIALASVALVLVLSWLALRPFVLRRWRVAGDVRGPGAAVAAPLVLGVVAVATWAVNPFAAALLVPALHLWLLAVAPDLRLRRPAAVALVLAGLAPFALVIAYYMAQFGLGLLDALWMGLLLVAGGQVGVAAIVAASAILGCLASVLAIALRPVTGPAPTAGRVPLPATSLTVHGPRGYAGPGSLGGTESALHR